jgi:phosphate transport system substrate-binding protein
MVRLSFTFRSPWAPSSDTDRPYGRRGAKDRRVKLKKSHLLWPLLALIYLPVVVGVLLPGQSGAGSSTRTGGGSSGSGQAVTVSGSSTVEPISIAVAERFADVSPGSEVDVDGPGTGDGFELFCNEEIDINDASRPIEPEEVEACEANGVAFIEIPIAVDGLSLLTSSTNDEVDCLSFADLYALVGPEAEGDESWSDAQALATELGSSTTLPDEPLDLTGPGEESGTYDSFVELALEPTAEQRVEEGAITEDAAATTRPDYTSQADDNAILAGVEGSDSSLGWVGFAFAEEAGDLVKELDVDGGDGCVAPSAATIADGTYPLSRTLYLYVNKASAERPEVDRYVDYYLRGGISAVEDVGYVALPDAALADASTAWSERRTGTHVGEAPS